jgi:hypothetical protein
MNLKNTRFCCSAILLAVISGTGSLARAQSSPGAAMLDCGGLPCIEATAADGIRLKMLVDTGNQYSLLDLAKAKELGLKLDSIPGTDGKPYPNYFFATLKDTKMGDASLGDLKVLVTSLHDGIAKGQMPQADGTLAYTAFQDRILRIDYKARRVEAPSTVAACTADCGELTTPTFGKKGPPIVVTTGFKVNGKPVSMQIDTLYSGSMLIFPTSVEKLNLQQQAASTTTRFFPFTDGGVDMLKGSAETESFGDTVLQKNAPLYFVTPKVHTPDGMFDGTVGHELFTGHVLVMDFHSRKAWLL